MDSSSSRAGSERAVGHRCEARSYDLTSPPTRDDLGMTPGKEIVDVSCDDGFDVKLALPQDAATTITARGFTADAYGSGDPESGNPTTIDVHSVSYDVAEAVQVVQGVADDLGIDSAPVRQWRADVESRGDRDSIDSPFMRSTVGYVNADLQVQHVPTSGDNYMHLILSWD